MIAKRKCRLNATVLLCVLIASFDTLECLPLSSSFLFDDLLYDEATSSDEDPVYRTNELYGLLDRHSLAEPPFLSEVFSTETENDARKLLGRRKSHGSIVFSEEKPEIEDREQDDRNQDGRLSSMHLRIALPFREENAGLPLYSAMVDENAVRPRKSSILEQRNRKLARLLAHLSKDESDRKGDRGMTRSKMKRVFLRLNSSASKRDIAVIRSEGKVHPVFLGFGQETTGAALSTLARLLADEERLHQMNSSDRTKESTRFIG